MTVNVTKVRFHSSSPSFLRSRFFLPFRASARGSPRFENRAPSRPRRRRRSIKPRDLNSSKRECNLSSPLHLLCARIAAIPGGIPIRGIDFSVQRHPRAIHHPSRFRVAIVVFPGSDESHIPVRKLGTFRLLFRTRLTRRARVPVVDYNLIKIALSKRSMSLVQFGLLFFDTSTRERTRKRGETPIAPRVN